MKESSVSSIAGTVTTVGAGVPVQGGTVLVSYSTSADPDAERNYAYAAVNANGNFNSVFADAWTNARLYYVPAKGYGESESTVSRE